MDQNDVLPISPKEPLFIQYVSEITGRVYDAEMVDHLADMLLIFYCAGGTTLGALFGASLGVYLSGSVIELALKLAIILLCGLAGSITGCALVMAILNLLGILKWDGLIIRRSVRLKSQ